MSDVEPRCARHRDPDAFPKPPACPDCMAVRLRAEAAQQTYAEREQARRADIRAAIDRCRDCDDYGRLIDDHTVACPAHPNFRTAS